jgi:hypothetical protein
MVQVTGTNKKLCDGVELETYLYRRLGKKGLLL